MGLMKYISIFVLAICCLLLASCDGKQKSKYVAVCVAQGIPKDMCACAYGAHKKELGAEAMGDYIRMEKMPDRKWNASMIDAMEECGLGKAATDMIRQSMGIKQVDADSDDEILGEPIKSVESTDAPVAIPPSTSGLVDEGVMAQCGKDTDCKGDRICESGQCRAPDAAVAAPSELMSKFISSPMEASSAACDSSEKILFSCSTTNQKHVSVCDGGASLRYVFGKDGERPEMNISVLREKVSVSQSAAGQAINLPVGNTVYSVSSGFKAMGERAAEAGIDVQVDGRHVARVACRPGTIQNSIDSVKLFSSL